MRKSSFSGKDIPPGKGITYVKKDGKILYFLNRKEEKNMIKLGRKPRKVTWTEEYRKEKTQREAARKHAEEAKKEQKKPAAKKKTKK
ncbi:MAG: 50S ribosomal protein L24e [Candidatus Woesearchaeota archaeon]